MANDDGSLVDAYIVNGNTAGLSTSQWVWQNTTTNTLSVTQHGFYYSGTDTTQTKTFLEAGYTIQNGSSANTQAFNVDLTVDLADSGTNGTVAIHMMGDRNDENYVELAAIWGNGHLDVTPYWCGGSYNVNLTGCQGTRTNLPDAFISTAPSSVTIRFSVDAAASYVNFYYDLHDGNGFQLVTTLTNTSQLVTSIGDEFKQLVLPQIVFKNSAANSTTISAWSVNGASVMWTDYSEFGWSQFTTQ